MKRFTSKLARVVSTSLLVSLLFWPLASGAPSMTVLVSSQADSVRFSAQIQDVQALRIEVFDLSGKRLFDSGLQKTQTLSWPMVNAHGQAVANGAYLYKVMALTKQGLRSQLGKVIILRGESTLGTSTVADLGKAVPLSHDLDHCQWDPNGPTEGRLFIAPLGCKVGIGTDTPSSPLTVAGLIETTTSSGGIKFPDGTIQTTAATGGVPDGWTLSDTTVRLTTITDKVGIGTMTPVGKLDVIGAVRLRNELNTDSYFEFQAIHADGRQRLVHRTLDGSGTEVQVLAARGSYGGGKACIAFGPGSSVSTTPSCAGLFGNMVITGSGPTLAISAVGIGGQHDVGTHKSLYIGTPDSPVPNTSNYGVPGIVDLGTFSAVANYWGGTRPSIRYTALSHLFRVDGSSGQNNEGTDALVIDSSGNVEVTGYFKAGSTSGAPPAADCDEASERGRMKVDSAAGLLYICVDTGWISK
ncbi:hypothetical protein HYR54_15470 [Candidatus Acetothermia bacterium]|nr:hypothetical protein [Candidatus Acetothermia bacterium]